MKKGEITGDRTAMDSSEGNDEIGEKSEGKAWDSEGKPDRLRW